MKLDTEIRNWGGGTEFLLTFNSYERPEPDSGNAQLGKRVEYWRISKRNKIASHLAKCAMRQWGIPRPPIQKWLGGLLFCPSLFCMGKREELAHRMAHFVKSCPIDFLFGIRGHEVFSWWSALFESGSTRWAELGTPKTLTTPPSAELLNISLHIEFRSGKWSWDM